MTDIEINFIAYFALCLFVIGIILSLLYKHKTEDSLEDKIYKVLPKKQCAQCGYVGCKEYAQAVANKQCAINKCIPGGPDTIKKLATLLNVSEDVNEETDDMIFMPRKVAFIHSSLCTGCTKCKRHCPYDAIVGNVKQPHSILKEECTGCGDCVKVCPERCIEIQKLEPTIANFNWEIDSIRLTGENK